MTIRQAIREQLKSIKNRSLREQISFFWEYYGIKTICLLLAIAVAVAFIVSIATQKEYGFTGVFFGAEAQPAADSYLDAFASTAGVDPDQYQLTVQTSPDIRMDQQMSTELYQSMEAFTAMVAARSVDCFAGHADLFIYYSYLSYATDLRAVLTPAELETLAPYLYYIDGKLLEDLANAQDWSALSFDQYPDSTCPENMDDPIPVAVALSAATEAFRESYRFGDNAVIGICASSEHIDNASAFLRYCLGL